jgi:hypothetical protein
MKSSTITAILACAFNFCNAQDQDFLKTWLLGFPTSTNPAIICKYGLADTNFKVTGTMLDTSCLFILQNKSWARTAPTTHPLHLNETDSISIEVTSDFIPSMAYDRPRGHYLGRTTTITVEYFLTSRDSIALWTDKLIRGILNIKYLEAEVYPQNSIEKYHFGEFLFLDNRKQLRRMQIMENYYVTGKISLLISYEFEQYPTNRALAKRMN